MVERAPTNDYALFCLGRSLQLLGRHAEARKPLALAACLRPEREDYRATATRRAGAQPERRSRSTARRGHRSLGATLPLQLSRPAPGRCS